MFVENVTGTRREWELVSEKSRLVSDPPHALLACVVPPDGEDRFSAVMVWESADQRGDWAAEVMWPLFESGELAEVTSNPAPVEPIALFVRR